MPRPSAVALAVMLGGCAPQFSVDGRPFTVSAPRSMEGNTPLPMLVLLHGYGVTAEAQDLIFNFRDDVDQRRFLYVWPNGTPDHIGKRFWNATDACCNFDHLKVD